MILWPIMGAIDQQLRIYEINALKGRGASPSHYTSLSREDYSKAFRKIPVNEWKPFYQKHLSSEELGKVTVTNIDKKLQIVIDRMHQARQENWQHFEETLNQPSYQIRALQALIRPYTYCFEQLR